MIESLDCTVNWGRGRLIPYESFLSFVVKFCHLNGITPLRFSKFFDEIFGQETSYLEGKIQKNIYQFSTLIDEPVSVAKTLFDRNLILPGCYGTFTFIDQEDFFYCPDCIKFSYHALFHTFPWLNKCLIHATTLCRFNYYGVSGSLFAKKVKILESLYNSSKSDWLSSRLKFSAWNDREKLKIFRKYRRWIMSSRSDANELCKSNVATFGGAHYSIENLDVLLGRLAWLNPIPSEISSYFVKQPLVAVPESIEFDAEYKRNLDAFKIGNNLDDLLWLYKKTATLANVSPRYQSIVDEAIETIKEKHTECQCKWVLRKYYGWQRLLPGNRFYWRDRCPIEVVLDEIGEWKIFFGERASSLERRDEWYIYRFMAEKFMRLGVVSLVEQRLISKTGEVDLFPLVKWNENFKLAPLIETILEKEFIARVFNLNNWLESCEDTKKSPPGVNPPANINLLCKSNGLVLTVWPPI